MVQGNLLPLDPTLFNLKREHLDFIQFLTGITCYEDVKQHIISVQARAYEVTRSITLGNIYELTDIRPQLYPYPCIRHFTFLKYECRMLHSMQ